MSEEPEKTEEASDGPVGGERLRAARRENNISVRDIAKELHLDEPKVRALERNEFDDLGAPVFAKGHLRKYAELVGVSVEDIMTDYYQMNRSVGAPPVVGPKRRQPRDFNAGPWIGVAVVVVILAAALYWWFAMREPAPAAPAIEPATLTPFTEPEPEEAVDAPVEDDTAVADDVDSASGAEVGNEVADETVEPAASLPEPAAAADEPVAAVEPGVDAGYEPTPGAPQVTVDLAFTGDCWTEVSDAGGRRLFYDLGAEGRVVTLSGDAPLRLILGDADNVAVTVDGAPYTIPAAARRGRLARLSINPR